MLQEQASLSPALLLGLPKAWVSCPGGRVRAYSTLKTQCAGTRHALWAGSHGRVPFLVLSPLLPVLQQVSVWTNLIHAVSSTHDDAHLGRTRDSSIPRPRRPRITYYLPVSFSRQLRGPGPQGEAALARLNRGSEHPLTVHFHKVLGRSKVDVLFDDCVWFSLKKKKLRLNSSSHTNLLYFTHTLRCMRVLHFNRQISKSRQRWSERLPDAHTLYWATRVSSVIVCN